MQIVLSKSAILILIIHFKVLQPPAKPVPFFSRSSHHRVTDYYKGDVFRVNNRFHKHNLQVDFQAFSDAGQYENSLFMFYAPWDRASQEARETLIQVIWCHQVGGNECHFNPFSSLPLGRLLLQTHGHPGGSGQLLVPNVRLCQGVWKQVAGDPFSRPHILPGSARGCPVQGPSEGRPHYQVSCFLLTSGVLMYFCSGGYRIADIRSHTSNPPAIWHRCRLDIDSQGSRLNFETTPGYPTIRPGCLPTSHLSNLPWPCSCASSPHCSCSAGGPSWPSPWCSCHHWAFPSKVIEKVHMCTWFSYCQDPASGRLPTSTPRHLEQHTGVPQQDNRQWQTAKLGIAA